MMRVYVNYVINVCSGCAGGPNEKRLLANLLDKYNTLERPVANESDPVIVSFGLTLMQIIDVVRGSAMFCRDFAS